MPKQRTSRKESQIQTRCRLLASARDLFVSHGYGGTSIRDVAEHAGYSQGAFYSNFASKEEVLLLLLEEHMQVEAAELREVLDISEGVLDKIMYHLDIWFSGLNRDVNWYMLSVELQLHAHRSPDFAEQYQKIWQRHQAELGILAEDLFRAFSKKLPVPVIDIVTACLAMNHGLALQRIKTSGNQPPDPSGRMMMLFLRGALAQAEDV